MKDHMYMKVTNDEYELPVAFADTLSELAKMLNVKANTITSSISHAKKKGFKSQYIKVTFD